MVAVSTTTRLYGSSAANDSPQPRTEGRSAPFRNAIEAQLAGRHLIGTWRNGSDTRYFGTMQLAVLPIFVHAQMGFSPLVAGLAVSAQYAATLITRPRAP